jgi:transcription initiation factor TFIIIB Brf1 subunit/transcription initiation factor TFIIB
MENVKENLSRLEEVCESLDYSKKVKKTSKKLYNNIYEEDLYYGRKIEDLLSGILLASCKIEEEPYNLDELSGVFDTTKNNLFISHKYISDELDLDYNLVNEKIYIEKLCQKLDLDDEIREESISIYNDFEEETSKKCRCPKSYASAFVYISCYNNSKNITQKEISRKLGLSTVTLRSSMEDIKQEIND